jgi:hypothetical protein
METVIGDGKPGDGADKAPEEAAKVRLNEPSGITKIAEGMFVISDTNNHRLMLWNKTTGKVERMKIEGEKMAQVMPAADSVKSGEAVAAKKRFSVRLPNEIPMAGAKVNRANPELRIILPERYKLNEEGPSFIRLFAGSPPKEVMVKEWKREDLQSSLTLSLTDLKAETEYFVQGTFYYCLDTKNAVCEIGSVSFGLQVDATGTDRVDVNLTSSGKKSQ